jgi:serine/threonine protein kinase/WD40 repeat protein
MSIHEPRPQEQAASSTSSGDERALEILGRCLDDLGGAADKAAVVADYCARYPELAEKIRDLARVGQVLGDTTSWGDVPPGDADADSPRLAGSASPPTRFGPYKVIGTIGRGGMGEVYEAEEDVLRRRVAVKTIRPGKATDPALLERFDRERRVLARLHDTHIVPIFATGQEGDLLYFAMPYIPGVALSQVIRTAQEHSHDTANSPLSSFAALVKEASSRTTAADKQDAHRDRPAATTSGPAPAGGASANGNGNGRTNLPPEYLRSVAAAIADVAEALHHAHADGIIHRDVKPSNIMVEPSGHPWLLDFGLARLKSSTSAQASTNGDAKPDGESQPTDQVTDGESVPAESRSLTVGTVGTLPYMAPEQIWSGLGQAQASDANTDHDSKIDARTDVWGVGATLYELLTLNRAFKNRDEILRAEPAKLRAHVPNLPSDLEAVCLKAMKKDPEHRYATAMALAEDLRRWIRHEPVTAQRARAARRLLLWSKRNKGWAAAILVTVLTVLALGIGGVILGNISAAVAKAKVDLAQAKQKQAEADAQHARLQAAAEHRDRVHQRELLVQGIRRIQMSAHRQGWRKLIDSMVDQAMQLGQDDGTLRPQAIGALRELDAHETKDLPYTASNLAFDPQGRRLFSCWQADQAIRVWDRETDEKRTLGIKGEGPFAFRADGTLVQIARVGQDDRTLVLHDLAREIVLRRFTSPQQDRPYISAVAFARRGSHVAAIYRATKAEPGREPADNEPPVIIAVWDAVSGALVRSMSHPATATDLALSPDARLLAVGDTRGSVALWNLPDGKAYANLPASDNKIQCLAFGRDPRMGYRQEPDIPAWQLAVGDAGGIITMLDVRGKRIRNIGRGSKYDIYALEFSPDGTMLASGGRGSRLWEVASGRLLLELDAGGFVPATAFSPDGRSLAFARWGIFGEKDGVRLFDLRGGRGMQSLLGLATDVGRVAFSRDGRLVGALADNWQVGIWETSSGQLRFLFDVPPGLFSDNARMAFDSDSRRFAFSAHEHATLWDLQTGRLVRTWKLPPALCDQLAFHGPDKLILFRCETRDRVAPFSPNRPKDHPRVYRLYDLLGPSPLSPITEIGDHDLHCFGVLMPEDGHFFLADGAGTAGGHRVRTVSVYEGVTGKLLWSMPSPRPDVDGCHMRIDPKGAVLVLENEKGAQLTLLRLPGREWMFDLDVHNIAALAPGGSRWFSAYPEPADANFVLRYFPEGRQSPAIPFLLDKDVFYNALIFDGVGRHVAWPCPDYSVTLCDLTEVQRAMSEYGLGW